MTRFMRVERSAVEPEILARAILMKILVAVRLNSVITIPIPELTIKTN